MKIHIIRHVEIAAQGDAGWKLIRFNQRCV